ncbi:MAG: succinylglutamate desuccinylase/aspartoacylase family protein [Pseudomonadota bacterium]
MANKTISIAGQKIEPGTRKTIFLPAVGMFTQTKLELPAHVIHGKHSGPTVFVIGVNHGDEVNGLEIIRHLYAQPSLKKLNGTLIIMPVSNVFAFILQSRYSPDRRDLNRCFPGNKNGSMTAQLAHMIASEIISQSDYVIDLHTGALGHINMPQLRVNLDVSGVKNVAKAFGVPVILNARVRPGSLREYGSKLGIPVLVYEGGEALRFNELAIIMGLRGILNVLYHLDMIATHPGKKLMTSKSVITETTRWVRAPASGMIQNIVSLAKAVKKDDVLAYIHDPFLMNKTIKVTAPFEGMIIGQTLHPLVYEGDALFHIATLRKIRNVSTYIDELLDEVRDNT